ncbi:glycoside hydrolase family 2 protein [Streptomyces sp. NPDC002526]
MSAGGRAHPAHDHPDRQGPQQQAAIPVAAPLKWDAEHPNLYTLTAAFTVGGVTETVTRRSGFRQVEVEGNQLVVNGKPVHLLGVCHHSITEKQGRSTNAAMEEQAARLYKEANCNYIRTSHYPPTPALLDWADRLGLYVEVEAPVCFQQKTVDDPAYAEQYMTQFAEMIERDRSHACVVEWSVGNESGMGRNFASENTYAHETDPSRPTVFEDMGQSNGGNQTDIYSGHYPSLQNANGNARQPIQYGEFAHVPCYNTGTLQTDPGVRDFWGHSIAKLAAKFRATNGVVGGAIWTAIDEVFHLPNGPVGYGEWGIIDLWRRRKPEFWLTQKAFSPVQIEDGVLTGQTPGGAVSVPVKNWHDHTNLGEQRPGPGHLAFRARSVGGLVRDGDHGRRPGDRHPHRFGTIDTTFTVSVSPRGRLTTTYKIANPPSGQVSDVGVRYVPAEQGQRRPLDERLPQHQGQRQDRQGHGGRAGGGCAGRVRRLRLGTAGARGAGAGR